MLIVGSSWTSPGLFGPRHGFASSYCYPQEEEWLRAAAANPAFDFLREPQEDIYTLADGRPFNDQMTPHNPYPARVGRTIAPTTSRSV